MASHDHKITLTIPSGQTTVSLVDRKMSQAVAAVLYCPATLPETVTVALAPSATSPTYVNTSLVPAAGKFLEFDPQMAGTFEAIKLTAGGAVAADRTFTLVLVIESD